MSDAPEGNVPDYPSFLAQLIAELASRELSLKIGRRCQLALREIEPDPRFAIPPEYALCAHLATGQPETRGALLLGRQDAELLVREAVQRQTLAPKTADEPLRETAARLLHQVFARAVVLLGFLDDRVLVLQGVTVQDVDTQPRRRAHEIAFQRQHLAPLTAALSIHGLPPVQALLLLPEKLLDQAVVRLADPDAVQATENLFLEHADLLNQELNSWLEAQEQERDAAEREQAEKEKAAQELAAWLEAQEEGTAEHPPALFGFDSPGEEDPFADLAVDPETGGPPFADPEVAPETGRSPFGDFEADPETGEPSFGGFAADPELEEIDAGDPFAGFATESGIDALDDLLASLLAELPQETGDVVLQSPEDLLFAQLFFPAQLARQTKGLWDIRVEVKPVEMAAFSLGRMSAEPPGLMARIHYTGPFEGYTAFVFPETGLHELAQRAGLPPTDLVQHLLQPGLAQMRELNARLQAQVFPARRVDFSRLETDRRQLSVRIAYRMQVEGSASLEFVQYAPTLFVNRLLQALLGQEGTQFLRPSARNMMLSFLDLNAALAAVVMADPERARAWIGPLWGPQCVPLFRPGEELPDLFDFDTLLELSDIDLRNVISHPSLSRLKPREIACALAFVRPELRGRILQNALGRRRTQIENALRRRAKMSLKEIWKARHEFGHLLYHAILREVDQPPLRIRQQLSWFLDQLGAEWRVRAAAILGDTVFFVAGAVDFDSLVDLSDRDLQRLLSTSFLLKRGPATLACAISPERSAMRGKVLRNLSETRRAEVAALLRERKWSPQEARQDQLLIAQMAYFTALQGDIHPPERVRRQIEQYLDAIGEHLLFRAHGVAQDSTFFSLAARLSPHDRRDLQGLVPRDDILWALQDCGRQTLAGFAQGMGQAGQEQLMADIGFAKKRVEDPDERVCRTSAARLRIIDAIRLVWRFRAEEG